MRAFAAALVMCVELMPGVRRADAQTIAYPSLFGPRNSTRPQSIDLAMSVTNGYDTANDLFGVDSLSLPVRSDGSYQNIDAVLRYTRARGKRRLMITAADTLRYQPVLQNVLTSNYQTAAAFTAPLGRRAHLELNQDVAYTPYYQVNLFPSLAVDASRLPNAPSNDFAVSKQGAYSYTTSVGFSHDIGLRSSFALGYDRRSVVFDDAARNLATQGGSFRIVHHATRRAALHVGLSAHTGRYGSSTSADAVHTEQLDIGLEYASRRATFSGSLGPAFIPVLGGTSTRVTGRAALRADLSRRWSANLQYDRSLRFVEALAYPFFADAISFGVTGQPSRRLTVGSSVGYSTGIVGVSAEGGTFGTYTGSAQVTVPISRHYAVVSEYLYYHYGFAEQAFAGALPPRVGRHTVRVGLKLWLPLLN